MTNIVKIGAVEIGGGRPVAVQSMTNTDTRDVASTVKQIRELEDAGCDIVRFAVPDMEAAAAAGEIRRGVSAPLVADIHFDYRLALECIRQGIDKVRINPGNIGDRSRVKAVADAARERGIPIRIGVNGGSLDKDMLEKYGKITPEALAESALSQAEILNMCGFYDIVVSIKSSDVFMTVEACRLFDEKKTGIPQHIGVTESGTATPGLVKSAIGIYELLRLGIGDTARVSLTSDPIDEVIAAKAILRTFNEMNGGGGVDGAGSGAPGIEIISCPTCGRCRIDLIGAAKEIERRICKIKTGRHIKVAVMGCAVNGPGEARGADIGIAGGDGDALLFKRGKPLRKIAESDIVDALIKEIQSIAD